MARLMLVVEGVDANGDTVRTASAMDELTWCTMNEIARRRVVDEIVARLFADHRDAVARVRLARPKGRLP